MGRGAGQRARERGREQRHGGGGTAETYYLAVCEYSDQASAIRPEGHGSRIIPEGESTLSTEDESGALYRFDFAPTQNAGK